MKKAISIALVLVFLFCMMPISVFASSDIEYLLDGKHTGIWYSNSATKEALDKCKIGVDFINVTGGVDVHVHVDLQGNKLDIYDDLLIDGSSFSIFTLNGYPNKYKYDFKNGTICCHDCRAFNLYSDSIELWLTSINIKNGNAICPDDYDYGYGGAIYVDGAACSIWDTERREETLIIQNSNLIRLDRVTSSYIENCNAERYGGAIAVCGHDCTITGLTFNSNTNYIDKTYTLHNNGGNDLYVYWGDCHVYNCNFDKKQMNPAAYITADTYFDGCNITKEMCAGDVHQVFITNPTGSFISEGNLWIIIAVAVLALGVTGAVIIVKKKKKLASNEKQFNI